MGTHAYISGWLETFNSRTQSNFCISCSQAAFWLWTPASCCSWPRLSPVSQTRQESSSVLCGPAPTPTASITTTFSLPLHNKEKGNQKPPRAGIEMARTQPQEMCSVLPPRLAAPISSSCCKSWQPGAGWKRQSHVHEPQKCPGQGWGRVVGAATECKTASGRKQEQRPKTREGGWSVR